MSASDLFKAGRLQEAIDAQLKEVKASPGDQAKRLFLFELVAFSGDLDRARRQIDAMKFDKVELETATLAYRKLLDSEQLRRRLFTETLKPEFFGEPSAHVHLRLEAINRTREGRPKEAAELLARADAQVPSLRGKLNGKDFASLRDCDDLFSHILEVFAQGRYFWVPLDQVESVTAKAPRFPRDLIWLPARLDMSDGAAGEVFLPALYPGSHEQTDDQLKLGRAVDYRQEADGPVRGVGSREFLVGDDVIPLLEWRELVLEPATPAAG
ncbi:MAG: SciE type virulence protein [Gemmataceae bacterium]|nr:SciE type virulence protein [Gemmataceae bacterium]